MGRAVTGAQLEAELAAALRALSASDRDTLAAAGIASQIIDDGLIGAARVRVTGYLYEPDVDGGGAAFLSPIRVDNPVSPEAPDPAATVRAGGLVDVVAWHPKHPRRWALRAGTADWLGAIEPQYLDPAPVPVCRSPHAWLRAGCTGLVVLSRELPAAYSILSGCLGGIVVEDSQHATLLRATLARPWPVPQIIVRRPAGTRRVT